METSDHQLGFQFLAESSEHKSPRLERTELAKKRHEASEVAIATFGLELRIIKEFERD